MGTLQAYSPALIVKSSALPLSQQNISLKIRNYLSLIKFSHTIFAMPFALIGFFLGIHQLGGIRSEDRSHYLVLFCWSLAVWSLREVRQWHSTVGWIRILML
jgi:hypothetical protein